MDTNVLEILVTHSFTLGQLRPEMMSTFDGSVRWHFISLLSAAILSAMLLLESGRIVTEAVDPFAFLYTLPIHIQQLH